MPLVSLTPTSTNAMMCLRQTTGAVPFPRLLPPPKTPPKRPIHPSMMWLRWCWIEPRENKTTKTANNEQCAKQRIPSPTTPPKSLARLKTPNFPLCLSHECPSAHCWASLATNSLPQFSLPGNSVPEHARVNLPSIPPVYLGINERKTMPASPFVRSSIRLATAISPFLKA